MKPLLTASILLFLFLAQGATVYAVQECKPGDNWTGQSWTGHCTTDRTCNDMGTCTPTCSNGTRTDSGCCSTSCHEPTPTPCPPLGNPSSLGFTCNSGTSITLNWGTAANAPYYSLRVDDTADGWNGTCTSANGDFCLDTFGTSYTFTATPGHKYNWWIQSRNYCGRWGGVVYGAAASCVPNCSSVSGPTTLVVGSTGTYSAQYESLAGNLKGELFRDAIPNSLGSTLIAGTSGTASFNWTPAYADAGSHTISCRAYNGTVSECRPSGLVTGPPNYACVGPNYSLGVNVITPTPTICPLPAAPSNLSCFNQSNGVQVRWTDNSSNEQGFKLYRDSPSGPLACQTGPNGTVCTDTTVSCDANNHSYFVTSYTACGNNFATIGCTGACVPPAGTWTPTTIPTATFTPTQTPTFTLTPTRTPTPTAVLPANALVVSKTSSFAHTGPTTWTITYQVKVTNTAATTVNQITVTDSIDDIFVGIPYVTYHYVSGSLTSTVAGMPANTTYTGLAPNHALVVNGALSGGQTAILSFRVQFTQAGGTNCADYSNNAYASGKLLATGTTLTGSGSDVPQNLCQPTITNTPTPTLTCVSNPGFMCVGGYQADFSWDNPTQAPPYVYVGGIYGSQLTPTVVVPVTPGARSSITLNTLGGLPQTPISGLIAYPRSIASNNPAPPRICALSVSIPPALNNCRDTPTATPTPTTTPTPTSTPQPWYQTYNASFSQRPLGPGEVLSNYIPSDPATFIDAVDLTPAPADNVEGEAGSTAHPYLIEGKAGLATFVVGGGLVGAAPGAQVSAGGHRKDSYAGGIDLAALINKLVGPKSAFGLKPPVTAVADVNGAGVYNMALANLTLDYDSRKFSFVTQAQQGHKYPVVLVLKKANGEVSINAGLDATVDIVADLNPYTSNTVPDYDLAIVTDGNIRVGKDVKYLRGIFICDRFIVDGRLSGEDVGLRIVGNLSTNSLEVNRVRSNAERKRPLVLMQYDAGMLVNLMSVAGTLIKAP